jgi:AtzE family amidohydrolase
MAPVNAAMLDASATDIAAAIRSGALRCEAHVVALLERIRVRNPRINAYVETTQQRALDAARRIDRMVAQGQDPGVLAGVPFAVKNLFDVSGVPTLAGSIINRDRAAAKADACLVARLVDAGAVLIGTLNMDEYAYGFTTENSHYGATRNPHDLERSAGGSSGGSGAAVAAGLAAFTLGSDTNGSIRVPSAHCGVFGLKPTFGRLPRSGSYPFVASLDHLGPLGRSAADLAVIYDVMQGHDAHDPACRPGPVEPVSKELVRGIQGLRIARAVGYFERNAQPRIVECVAQAALALGVRATVDLAQVEQARAAAYVITAVEGAQLHARDLRERPDDFDPHIRDRMRANALLPAQWYVHAQRFRRRFHRQLMSVFEDVDVLLAPSTPWCATPLGQETVNLNGREVPTRPSTGLLTQPISFVGLPVAAVPVGRIDGLPVGMQVIAAPWREDLCLRVARALEEAGVARCSTAPWITE